MSKYRNRKTLVDGFLFDSKKEAERYKELSLLQKAGEIFGLELQKKYILIPTQYETTNEVYKAGEKKGQPKKKVVERECSYVADFVYTDKSGKTVVEDCKGIRTEAYKLKRKLMLWLNGIKIKET